MQGWVPCWAVNFAMEAVPLNIARIRKLLGAMPEAMRQRLTAAPREQVRGD
jgi:hypothetical protein